MAANTVAWQPSEEAVRQAGHQPTVDDVRIVLRRVLDGSFDQTWADVCAAAGIPTDASAASEVSFDDLLTAVSLQSRLCHVLAMSWRIRVTAAHKLAELGR